MPSGHARTTIQGFEQVVPPIWRITPLHASVYSYCVDSDCPGDKLRDQLFRDRLNEAKTWRTEA